MAGELFVNTFGPNDDQSFSSNLKYHYQVMNALTERGYTKVEGGKLSEGESWIGDDGGYVVHAKLEKGGKAIFFMTRTRGAADKVIEALKLSIVGIHLDEPIKVSVPE